MNFYNNKLEGPLALIPKKANLAGSTFGLSTFVKFSMQALIFYIAAILARDYDISARDVFGAIFSIMMAAMGSANSDAFLVDEA